MTEEEQWLMEEFARAEKVMQAWRNGDPMPDDWSPGCTVQPIVLVKPAIERCWTAGCPCQEMRVDEW